MIKNSVLFFGFISCMCVANVQLEISSANQKAIPLLIGGVERKDEKDFVELMSVMKKNFTFTNQFAVESKLYSKIPTKKEVKELSKNYLFALFITANGPQFEWRLYDTLNGTMVAGKKYTKRGSMPRSWAYNMSDMIWPALTGQEGFFSTRIAYCKEAMLNNKKVKHVYIADYDGSNEERLVDTPTINVAPRWNNDYKNPMVFYSDFTNVNVRLMVSDMRKKREVASDFEGVNMIPAFSRDGKKLVYCISRGDGQCQLYYYRKGVFKKLTHNNGNNISPSIAEDGKTIYFSSDFQTGSPQIYSYNLNTDTLERITDGGYCVAPRYSMKARKLAYSKTVKGVMQIFVYDAATKAHTQLTHDAGNKEECSWSPCGTKILYSVEEIGKGGRIAMMSLLSGEKHYLTQPHESCSFPDWSPVYYEFPIVTTS